MSFIKKTFSTKSFDTEERPHSKSFLTLRTVRSRTYSRTKLLESSFTNQSLIGRGSFGEVYKASWTEKKNEVALKKVQIKQNSNTFLTVYRTLKSNQIKNLPNLGRFGKIYKFSKTEEEQKVMEVPEERTEISEKRTRKEMEAEIKLWKALQTKKTHYSLLFLHDSYYIQNECWLIMALCSKGNLYFFVKNFVYDNFFPLTLDICLEILAPILSATNFMHSLGYIHRDIKPENILLTDRYVPKLADFTLSLKFKKNRVHKHRSYVKHIESYSGTPSYSPPESFFGEFFNSTWDTWSLSLTLLYLKFGKVAWNLGGQNVSDDEICKLFSEAIFNKVEKLNNSVDENLNKIEEIEEIEKEYLVQMFILPKNKFVEQRTEDDFEWCDKRLKLGNLLKKTLKWSKMKRLTVQEMINEDMFKERVKRWDQDSSKAGFKLKEKIESWMKDKTIVDDKWLIF